MAMMATTIMISTRVKPFSILFMVVFLFFCLFLFTAGTVPTAKSFQHKPCQAPFPPLSAPSTRRIFLNSANVAWHFLAFAKSILVVVQS
jgi:hypothetical protein